MGRGELVGVGLGICEEGHYVVVLAPIIGKITGLSIFSSF